MDYDFTIVFKKLEEGSVNLLKDSQNKSEQKDTRKEMDEISELRKIVLETIESDVNSYTTA